MKRLLLFLALPVLACAARQVTATTATAAAGPHWTATVRASVLLQCQAKFQSEKFCDCLTEKLEVISPDPDVEFTQSDVAAGVDACNALRATTAGTEPEAPAASVVGPSSIL